MSILRPDARSSSCTMGTRDAVIASTFAHAPRQPRIPPSSITTAFDVSWAARVRPGARSAVDVGTLGVETARRRAKEAEDPAGHHTVDVELQPRDDLGAHRGVVFLGL